MKKLMTMLAAVATAFGLFAADAKFISGAGFDTSDTTPAEGATNMTWTTPAGFDLGYWKGVTTETAVWTEGTSRASDNTDRPARFLSEDDIGRKYDGYLTLNTGTGLVSANILLGGDAQTIGDDGLYFDGLVQFTSFEDAPAIDDDAKIAVFPMVDDPDADTLVSHLIIKAQGTAETNLWKTAKVIDDGWHRVTIKMINDILKGDDDSQVGFVVYIDGVAVECDAAKAAFVKDDLTSEAKSFYENAQLFGSLGNSAEMTDVAFAGKGAIDEIAFTETAPDFAKSPIFCTLTGATGIASFDADGKTWIKGVAAIEAEIKSGNVNVTAITADTEAGYFIPVGAGSTNFTDVVKGDVLTVDVAKKLGATVVINDVPQYYESAAAALEDLNAAGTVTATLALNDNSGAIEIDNANLTLTLDLAGKKITQGENDDAAIVLKSGALKIIDSDGSGVVAGNGVELENVAILSADEGTLEIAGGTFDGTLTVIEVTISDMTPKFGYAANLDEASACGISYKMSDDLADKALLPNAEQNPTYWIVGAPEPEIEYVTFTVTDALEAFASITFKTNGFVVVDESDTYTVETNAEVTIEYTLKADFKVPAITYDGVTVENGTFVAGKAEAVVAFSATAKVYAGIPTAKTGLVYTGEALNGLEGGTGWIAVSDTTGTDAKEYTAVVKIADNCDGWLDDKNSKENRSITWKIDRASNTITGTIAQDGWTAGENPKPADLTGVTATFGTPVAAYYSDQACTEAMTPSTDTVAGTYYVRAEVAGTDNYGDAVSAAVAFTVIEPAPQPMIDPTEPSGPMSAEKATELAGKINTNPEKYITVPAEFGEIGQGALATYQTYFMAVVTGSGDNSKVELQLNKNGEDALKATLDGNDGVKKIKPADIAAGMEPVKTTVAAVPGFYYGVKAGNGLGNMAIRSNVAAKGETVELTMPKFTGAGFYTIVASPKPLTVVPVE